MNLVAKTFFGLEPLLAEEIKALGGKNIDILKRAVAFEGDKRLLYRANLELRTAVRILVPIATFCARDERELYQGIYEIDWGKYMVVKDTLAVDGTTSSQIFTHSKYVALKTKDAIVDQFRERYNRRPNVNTVNPTLRVNIFIQDDSVTVSLDSSGESLHKRGYKVDALEAPLNEVLAAGMLLQTGWKGDSDLIDPMCGSGTLPIEALMIARNIPANLYRPSFGFQRWKKYDPVLWKEVVAEACAKVCPLEHKIYGYDKDFQAVRIARRNTAKELLEGQIEFKRSAFERLEPISETGILVMNPPYDVRLEDDNINDLYKMIGDLLKQRWEGYQAWILSSNKDALKCVGLRGSKKMTLYNGALECKYQRFDLYKGSKKQKHNKV